MASSLPQCTLLELTPNYEPPQEACAAADAGLTLETAQSIAWKYAPYLWHHPLEKYHLAYVLDIAVTKWSVDSVVNGPGGLYVKFDGDPQLAGALTPASMYNSSRNYDTMINAGYYYFAYNFSSETGNQTLAGAPFENGLSTAPLYYNVYEYSSSIWVFNYYMFFSWNGCSNQWMVSQDTDNTAASMMYYLCNLGVHEGDWESVSVMVCKNSDGSARPLAVKYNQHDWNQIFDCSKTTSTGAPQCVLTNGTHPVGYIALNSHATYPVLSANIPYISIPNIPVLYNLRGMYLVDRTYKDDSKRWEPTPDNVVLIPNADQIVSADNPSGGAPDPSHCAHSLTAWATFAGRWGESGGKSIPLEAPYCLDATGTQYTECNAGTDPLVTFAGEVMGVDTSIPVDQRPWYFGLANTVLDAVGSAGKGPKGPLAKDFWNKWVNSSAPPIIGADSQELRNEGLVVPLCPDPSTWTPLQTSTKRVYLGGGWDLAVNFAGVVILFALIAVLYATAEARRGVVSLRAGVVLSCTLGVFFGTSLCAPMGRRSYMSESGSAARMAAPFRKYAPLWMGLFFAVALMGYLMFGIAHDGIITGTLQDIVSTVNWEALTAVTIALGVVILVVEFLAALWCLAHYAYVNEKLVGSGWRDKARVFVKNHGDAMYGALLGLMFFCTMLVIWLWFYTIVMTSVWVFVGRACASTLGVLTDGICVDLSVIGITSDIACGPDFVKFCNNFERRTLAVMFWGCTMVTAATLLMLLTLLTIMWQYRAHRMLEKDETQPLASPSEGDQSSTPIDT